MALFAGHHKLSNLYVFVDYNRQQGFGTTDEILNLDSLIQKFQSFKWDVHEVNGHSFKELINLKKITRNSKKPKMIIANTIKGKGVHFMKIP